LQQLHGKKALTALQQRQQRFYWLCQKQIELKMEIQTALPMRSFALRKVEIEHCQGYHSIARVKPCLSRDLPIPLVNRRKGGVAVENGWAMKDGLFPEWKLRRLQREQCNVPRSKGERSQSCLRVALSAKLGDVLTAPSHDP
jgi:hypothetical protein